MAMALKTQLREEFLSKIWFKGKRILLEMLSVTERRVRLFLSDPSCPASISLNLRIPLSEYFTSEYLSHKFKSPLLWNISEVGKHWTWFNVNFAFWQYLLFSARLWKNFNELRSNIAMQCNALSALAQQTRFTPHICHKHHNYWKFQIWPLELLNELMSLALHCIGRNNGHLKKLVHYLV